MPIKNFTLCDQEECCQFKFPSSSHNIHCTDPTLLILPDWN